MIEARLVFRFLSMLGHILAGASTILFRFPFLDAEAREKRLVRWSARLLKIAGVKVTVEGRPPLVRGQGALIVANHVSWLDIHVVHSLVPAHFISKADVRGWPVVGWLAEKGAGTLFLARSRQADAKRVNNDMAEHLRAGECLALFPEGTTSDGAALLPFYASLFQPAVEADIPVRPTLIRYLTEEGERCEAAAYYGETSLLQSLVRVLRQPEVHAEITFLPPIPVGGRHRRELAAESQRVIRERLAACGPGNPPESGGRLPA